MEKQLLRQRYKELRRAIVEKDKLSKVICEQAIECLNSENFSEISCYFPLVNEVDTRALVGYCLMNFKNIYLPHISPNEDMKMYRLSSMLELEESDFGIHQINENCLAQGQRELNLNDLEVVFTPLVAFDKDKNRLGYGKGHYDKFFSKCPVNVKKIGLAFSKQECEHIPTELHDIELDLVITEKDIF